MSLGELLDIPKVIPKCRFYKMGGPLEIHDPTNISSVLGGLEVLAQRLGQLDPRPVFEGWERGKARHSRPLQLGLEQRRESEWVSDWTRTSRLRNVQ